MRILFTTTGGIGHLHPLVPLATAAAQAGHDVAIAAPGSLGATLTARRLPHLALPDFGPRHLAHVEQVVRRVGPPGPGAELEVFREVFGWAKTDSTLAAMQQTVATWRPDLVLHEAAELAGPMAAEAADVPHATVAMALRRTLTAWAAHVAAGAAPLATAIGLPADHAASRILDVPFASLVPPSLEDPGAAVPEEVVRYRLTDLHPGGRGGLAGRRDGHLVWITVGTVAAGIPGVLDRVVPLVRAATAALPHVRFLLTTGSPDVAPTMPANVEVTDYVPQEEVLARCDAVVGHGGFNTTMAALSHGKPQVVMPLFATDQFETAARLAEVGAATTVTDPTPADLATAVERALTDPEIGAVAERLAAEMAGLPTPGQAVERLLAVTNRALV